MDAWEDIKAFFRWRPKNISQAMAAAVIFLMVAWFGWQVIFGQRTTLQISQSTPTPEATSLPTRTPAQEDLPWIRETRTISMPTVITAFTYVCPFNEGEAPQVIHYQLLGSWHPEPNDSNPYHSLFRGYPPGQQQPEWRVGEEGEVLLDFVCERDPRKQTDSSVSTTPVGEFRKGQYTPYRELNPARASE